MRERRFNTPACPSLFYPSLCSAALNGHAGVVRELVGRCDVDVQSQNGSSALHNAASGARAWPWGFWLCSGLACCTEAQKLANLPHADQPRWAPLLACRRAHRCGGGAAARARRRRRPKLKRQHAAAPGRRQGLAGRGRAAGGRRRRPAHPQRQGLAGHTGVWGGGRSGAGLATGSGVEPRSRCPAGHACQLCIPGPDTPPSASHPTLPTLLCSLPPLPAILRWCCAWCRRAAPGASRATRTCRACCAASRATSEGVAGWESRSGLGLSCCRCETRQAASMSPTLPTPTAPLAPPTGPPTLRGGCAWLRRSGSAAWPACRPTEAAAPRPLYLAALQASKTCSRQQLLRML